MRQGKVFVDDRFAGIISEVAGGFLSTFKDLFEA